MRPVAQNDQATAVEREGSVDGTPGVNPSANLLTNDPMSTPSDTKTIDEHPERR